MRVSKLRELSSKLKKNIQNGAKMEKGVQN